VIGVKWIGGVLAGALFPFVGKPARMIDLSFAAMPLKNRGYAL